MSSLRQKESKIPLRVDSKLKNVSKIPLRVSQKTTLTKPKIFPSTEPELKRTSAIDRNRRPTTEVKRVNKSNLSSQVLKERNKKAAKEIPQKLKPAQGKQKENPLCSFDKRIPKVNMLDDDLFKTSTEEKQIKNSNHPSQPNIEFVADERMKKLILSNRELTPSILKSCSNIKTSSVMERPSLYKKLNKVPVDPYKQALADIANCDLASEGRRFSEMQKSRLYLSPAQNRNSLYKPSRCVGDPYQEALKSIAKLRMQQKIKSCKKKVTFNLSGDDQSSDSEAKDANHGEKPVATIQPKLSKINEKSSGSNTLPSPEFEGNMLLTPGNNPSKKVTFDTPKTDEVLGDRQISKKTDLYLLEKKTDLNQLEKKTDLNELGEKNDFHQLEKKTDFFINKTSALASSLKTAANNEEIVHDLSPILHTQKTDKYISIFNNEIRNSILRTTVNPFLNSVRTSEVRQSLFSNQSERFLDKMNPKIFTPQPVSFYPQTKLSESISPEFLSRRTTDILSCAPINTPLVLKSLSRHELSPVCKKLEFKDSPKESKKEAGDSRENSQTFNLQNIMTQQKILDQLAHQECSIFMHEAQFPCEIRENLQNPIARILNNGDEMHFVPLWRLS
ncbi:hypothetical protein AVEN_23710-1 [Araneus ventricosus]|uniref:Uncharacterized protein n=1 Tax=Araneus ventricosus TaxID=182803 RepID=A0A4Y2J5J8_ARAVE|nr:hypothetical protein AVEN_23710-1 [Araneus ventricosus]